MAELPAPTPIAAWYLARLCINAGTSAVNPDTLPKPWDTIGPLLAGIPVGQRTDRLKAEVEKAGYNGNSDHILGEALGKANVSADRPPSPDEPEPWYVTPPTHAVMQFDSRWLLSSPLVTLVSHVAKAAEWPAEFLAAPMLSILAACIGNTRSIAITEMWHEFPIIWNCVVSPPGGGKTPSLQLIAAALYAIQGKWHDEWKDQQEEYLTELAQWEGQSKAQRGPKPFPPKQTKVLVSDTTLEALVRILDENPRGLLLERDELIGWIGSFNQYKKNGGSDRQAWLSMWSGKDFAVDRKADGYSVFIRQPAVSVAGGIQPDRLRDLQAGAEDGLVDRLLLWWPETNIRRIKAVKFPSSMRDAYKRLLEALLKLTRTVDDDDKPIPVECTLTPEAFKLFSDRDWAVQQQRINPDLPRQLCNAYAKMGSHAARIALVLHVALQADGTLAEDDTAIDRGVVDAAWNIVECSMSHLRKVYAQASEATSDERATRAVDWIERHGRAATVRDLVRANVCGVKTASAARQLLKDLADRHLGTITEDTAGHRQQISFSIPSEKDAGS